MKNIISVIIIALLAFSGLFAQKTSESNDSEAEKWLSHLYKKYKSSPYSLDFKMTISGSQIKKEVHSGKYSAHGQKFYLIADDVSSIYNGKTMWSIQHKDKEVLVSNSSGKKNKNKITTPMDVISKYKKNFKYRVKGKKDKVLTIELVPKSKYSSYFKIDLTFNTSNSKVISAKVYERSGVRILYSITNMKIHKSLPLSHFQFDASEYKDYEVLDLR